MKHFYLKLLTLPVTKNLLFSFLFLGFYFISNGQVYRAILTGPAEAPPNASPGIGEATVTITGNDMRVQASFSGLIGNTTASHIHAATAIAGTGAAGVATTTPTFTGFPLGVTAGTYDRLYDMTLAGSYNPAYVTANGGIAAAFAALKAALNAGKAYFNIHSTSFGGGEIRGFLVLCPNITVTIPDAFALSEGVLPNTVYPAYAPASSLTLQANVSGGTGPYSYSWSNGATTASTSVSPVAPTVYTVNVEDQIGCPGTASKTVNVMDISGGNNGNKIVVCHKGGKSLTIAGPAVNAHLGHGDMLGECLDPTRPGIPGQILTEQHHQNLTVRALSNPSSSYFELQLSGRPGSDLQVRVFDMVGRVIETRTSLQVNQTLRLGEFYKPGIYLVQIIQGTEKQTLRLVKAE